MSKAKQILQMLQDGYSQQWIASTLCVSRNTVAKVSKDALESMEEMKIHNTLFLEEGLLPTLVMLDFSYIHKELLKSGVTLKLLWQEYAEYGSMSIHERLMLLVDAKYDSQHNNNIKRLIKNAKFSDAFAFLGNIDYLLDQHLNGDLLELMEYRCGQASTIFLFTVRAGRLA